MYMETEYTPEHIADAEKICQLLQDVPESRRQLCVLSMMAYMNGIEAGMALEHDERQETRK